MTVENTADNNSRYPIFFRLPLPCSPDEISGFLFVDVRRRSARPTLIGAMTFSSRLTPQELFPERLEELTTDALEILNSKLHRQAGFEYQQDGETEPETSFRLEFVAEELDRRDALAAGSVRENLESAPMANA